MTRLGGLLLLVFVSLLWTSGAAQQAVVLENRTLRAVLADGRLESLVDVRTGRAIRFGDETFSVTLNGQTLAPSAATRPEVRSQKGRVAFAYAVAGARLTAIYELQPDWGFVSKRIRIEPTGAGPFRVNEIGSFAAAMAPAAVESLPLSEGRFGMIYRLPSSGARLGLSFFMLHQNPYNVFTSDGLRVRAAYTPEMDWHSSNGVFESDRLLLGLVPRSGRSMPARSVPEWTHVADYDRYLRENPAIDEAESDALVESVRAFLLYRPTRSIRVHVPWCENDYQIDVATPEGWAEYQRILDMAAQLGVRTTLFAPSNSALSSLAENRDAWGWENLLFFAAFPDLHTDRVSADRQRFAAWKYRVERFVPPEIMPGFITHQTERTDGQNVMRRDRFRPRDWDVLGWKYSLLSSIGTAPFNHTVSFITARDEDEFKALSTVDKAFFRRWLDWTDTHAEMLRHLKPIMGPPMLGRVDGTAAIAGGRGFVFVFNPNYRTIEASIKLDASIGLTEGARFVVKELHPDEGRLVGRPGAGFWNYGDDILLTMLATEALVLEIAPAPTLVSTPLLFSVTGKATIGGSTIAVTEAVGEPGTSRHMQVALPGARNISRVTVNGKAVPFRQERGVVEASLAFEGRAFGRGASVFPYDPAFAGGRLSGSVVIPGRIFAQLAARKAAWPVRYTPDDLRAPWLGSHRLLVFVQIAEPDDSLDVTLTIDGQPIELVRGYNSIYGHQPKRTFPGFYADLSTLAPDVEHRVELRLPALPPGKFQGLFFENVEPERTGAIR